MTDVLQAPLGGLFRMAVVSGTPELVRTHLRRGANVNARDANGATPLMLALARGRADVCRLLLEEGADPRLLDSAGRSALAYAQQEASWVSRLDLAQSPSEGVSATTAPAAGSLVEKFSAVREPPRESRQEQGGAVAVVEASAGDEFAEAVDDDGGWEPETESKAPVDDRRLRKGVADVQANIARHRAISRDPDWDDIEINLPVPAAPRVRNPVRLRELERLRRVFRRAVAQGSYVLEDIEAALTGDPAEDDGAARRLSAAVDTLAAMGPVPEPWDEWRPFGHPVQSLPAEDALDAACEHFEVHWSREDIVEASLRRLAKLPPFKVDQERLAWGRYEAALQSLFAAMADNPSACAQLAIELRTHCGSLVRFDQSAAAPAGDEPEDAEDDWVVEREAVAADAAAHGWSAEQLAETAALLNALSDPAASGRGALRDAFLADVRERRLPGSLLVGAIAPGDTHPGTKAALASFLKVRDQIFDANSRLAMWIARRYGWSALPLEDRYQEASQGLLKAIDRFDPQRGRFATYGVWWIRQTVTRAISDLGRIIRIPVHLQETLHRVDKERESLARRLGREPLLAELAARLALPAPRLRALMRAQGEVISLDSPTDGDHSNDLAQTLPDMGRSAESHVFATHLATAVRACLLDLSPREERILRQRFGLDLPDDMTLEEVGSIVDLTRERIRQIEAKALRKLSSPARSRRLRPFLGTGA